MWLVSILMWTGNMRNTPWVEHLGIEGYMKDI